MAHQRGEMKLGVLLVPTGMHQAAWRHPAAPADAVSSVEAFVELARTAERGKFDFLFWADFLYVPDGPPEAVSRTATYSFFFEPVTLVGALIGQTSHLGFVITASATFQPAYTVARQLASLNLMSGGRIGWNVVTSTQDLEARNYGLDQHLEHGDRYARAREYVDVVVRLWDSVEPDAIVADKESGRFFDPAKVHALDHKGEYLSVRGPLNVPPSGHGRPVIVQAGSSSAGRELAASVAEVIFTAQHDLDAAIEFRDDVRARAQRNGRSADDVVVMPGLVPVIGASEQEAQERWEELNALVDPDQCRGVLQMVVGNIELADLDIDAPLPVFSTEDARGPISGIEMLNAMTTANGWTLREAAQFYAGGLGHLRAVGTPAQIADVMEEWFVSGGCDGFNIAPALPSVDLAQFVDQVVPELQRRGLFRHEYRGPSLRENLGLRAATTSDTRSPRRTSV